MPDLKLEPLLQATQPQALASTLDPFLSGSNEKITVHDTRLLPPICYWSVYQRGERLATLKSFFSEQVFQQYIEKLDEYYQDRVDVPDHANGGLRYLPELNGILWGFPFDPSMPELYKCADGAWVGQVLDPASGKALLPAVRSYRPELGAVLSYTDGATGKPVAYGKCAPGESAGRIFVIMQRLWDSEGRRTGDLNLARPLAFRPDADLLLQAPVEGTPVPNDRNLAIFLDLVQAAGRALAALQAADVPFGEAQPFEDVLARLRENASELALTAPPLHPTMQKLLTHLVDRGRRSHAGPLGPSHGDFKWDQFLEHDGTFSLIDFELFGQAEAERDVGYFCAYLAPSHPSGWQEAEAAEMLRAQFLSAYSAARGAPPNYERVGLYEAATLALRALAHVGMLSTGWFQRAAQMLDLAFERLVSPEPRLLTGR